VFEASYLTLGESDEGFDEHGATTMSAFVQSMAAKVQIRSEDSNGVMVSKLPRSSQAQAR
jgi:hypothetical protein